MTEGRGATQLRASFCLVTPAFAGGADAIRAEIRRAEFRPAAMKSLVAFWWRAIQWHRFCRVLPTATDTERVACLRRREAELFGAEAQRGQGGQGAFRFFARIRNAVSLGGDPLAAGFPLTDQPGHSRSGIRYLLGEGLAKPTRFRREALVSDGVQDQPCVEKREVRVELRFLFSGSEDVVEVAEACWLLGTLGGFGTRSRHGLGSLALTALECDADGLVLPAVPRNGADIVDGLSALCANAGFGGERPCFTAFGARSQIAVRECASDNPWAALNEAGDRLLNWRSNAPGGRTKSDGRFRPDHDLVYRFVNSKTREAERHPERLAFGAPHNYFLRRANRKVEVEPVIRLQNDEDRPLRRASPLFLHLHRFADGSLAEVWTHLPARFLPETAKVRMRVLERIGQGPGAHWQKESSDRWKYPEFRHDDRALEDAMDLARSWSGERSWTWRATAVPAAGS